MGFKQHQKYAVIFILALFVALPLFPLAAQTNTSTLRGQVTDPSGSAVPTATVLVTTPNGYAITANTNREGVYEVKGLAPGKYGVKVIATGFTAFEKDGVEIAAGQTQKLDVKLAIETQEQKVIVTDQAAAALEPPNWRTIAATAPVLAIRPASDASLPNTMRSSPVSLAPTPRMKKESGG